MYKTELLLKNLIEPSCVLDFISVCESSTEFHFANVEDQLETIKEVVKEGIAWRKNHSNRDSTHNFLNLTSSEQQVSFF